SSPVMRWASSSLTAMRARRATRFTVARSTDMEHSGRRQNAPRPIAGHRTPRNRKRTVPCSGLEHLAYLRHHDPRLRSLHPIDELVGGLVDDREGAVVAGNGGFELEEAAAGKRGNRATHGEAVADRHDADVGLVQFLDQ